MQSLSALSEITGAKENSEGEPQDNSGEGLQHDGGNQSEKDSEYTSIEETFFHGILITFHTCHSLPIDCFFLLVYIIPRTRTKVDIHLAKNVKFI